MEGLSGRGTHMQRLFQKELERNVCTFATHLVSTSIFPDLAETYTLMGRLPMHSSNRKSFPVRDSADTLTAKSRVGAASDLPFRPSAAFLRVLSQLWRVQLDH